MASLLEVRKQISAIRNTRKITKAMQLMATARMKHFQKQAVAIRYFAVELLKLWHGKLSTVSGNDYADKGITGKKVFVLYSSDKGLCGGLNQQLIKTLLNSPIWKETPEANRIVVVFGKKGEDYLRYRKIVADKSFTSLPDNLSITESLQYVDEILTYWKREDVESIYMVAPHYKSSLVFYPMVKQFLPLSTEMLASHMQYIPEEVDAPKEELIYFEPGKEEIVETVMQRLVQLLFAQAFSELKASEYSSRMLAMQNATQAADKITDEKTRILNNIRQQKITQEIAEITGAQAVIT